MVNIVSSVSFCCQDANNYYAYATRQGILMKIGACEQLQKFCEHEQASTHLIFVSNSSKGQILQALSNCMEPLNTPNFIFEYFGFLGHVQLPCFVQKLFGQRRQYNAVDK